jgi:hypothetical protein
MNPPEDYAVDDDAADIVEQSSPRQELVAYPTSGTRQGDEEEVKVEEEDDMAASWAGQPAIKGSTESMRMALLTFSLIGLQ